MTNLAGLRESMLEKLRDVQLALLRGRSWRYLRYIHFRDYLSRVSDQVTSVCVCGAGHGLAELACAIEFPHINFTLTDIISDRSPCYHRTMSHAWLWGITNLQFSVWNVLHRTDAKFDLVASTEMLEHVEDVSRAVRNMRKAATKYVYCLVPFADDLTNANPVKRQRVWRKHCHFVFGFDQKSLTSLFGPSELLAGAYWRDAGSELRRKLLNMTDAEIQSSMPSLMSEALLDIRDEIPKATNEAAGIKILARADSLVPANAVLPPPLDQLQTNPAD